MRGQITALLKGHQAPTIAATIGRESRIKGKAHGQESTVRGYQLRNENSLIHVSNLELS
jgi:hypothetical protein